MIVIDYNILNLKFLKNPCVQNNIKKQKLGEGKLFFTEECQLANVKFQPPV